MEIVEISITVKVLIKRKAYKVSYNPKGNSIAWFKLRPAGGWEAIDNESMEEYRDQVMDKVRGIVWT